MSSLPHQRPTQMKPFSTTIMEDVTATAEQIISKWEVGGSAYSKATYTSLFREGRDDAPAFLSAVVDLKKVMNSFLSRGFSGSPLLSRAHKLMEAAMARLQKEFRLLLSSNLPLLRPVNSSLSSDDDEDDEALNSTRVIPTTAAMDDLRSITGCMLPCGYTKECVKVYTSARRSVVEEGLSRLGHVNMNPTQVRKLDWDDAERRIRRWVAGSRDAVRTLFVGERSLCDCVFGSSSKSGIKEAVFAEVAKEPAVQFLRFPEMVSTKRKSSPEKIFHYLNLYDSLWELYPEIRSLFSYRSTAAVPSQARASLRKLGEIVRSSLDEFESAIQNDLKENGSVPGGGLHPLTRYVMNYLSVLADYTEVLGDILVDHPPVPGKPLPEPFAKLVSPATTAPSSPSWEEDAGEVVGPPPPAFSSRVKWLVLLLLGKLDGKAETYKDAALSYLFLANNVRYMVRKVCTRDDLRRLLGEEWVEEHEEKARSFAGRYERLGWSRVVEAIPGNVVERGGAKERMAQFETAFEEAYRRQSAWLVTDSGMRDELKVSIAGKVMVPYKEFYEGYVEMTRKEKGNAAACRAVRFTPEDIGNYLSDLFYGQPAGSSSGSSRSSGRGSGSGSGSGSSRRRRRRSG